MPGHAGSWCKGYPEVCPSPTCTQPLNPASPATFELITAMLGEITGMKTFAGLFPETMVSGIAPLLFIQKALSRVVGACRASGLAWRVLVLSVTDGSCSFAFAVCCWSLARSPVGCDVHLTHQPQIHLGGDEVNTKCWTKEPSIMAWLQARNLTTDGGYGYFVNKTAHIAVAQGRRPIQW